MNARVTWAVGLALACAAAHAQDSVQRCGTSYSREPCAGGSAVAVDDARTADQLAQARKVALLDARRADALERQRLTAEQAAARQGPVLLGTSSRVAREDERTEHARQRRAKPKAVTLYRASHGR